MGVYRRAVALALIVLGVSMTVAGCGGAATASVDRSEGTLDLTINGTSANHQPLACSGRTKLSGSVQAPGGPGSYFFEAALQGNGSARVDVSQSQYKAESIDFTGTAQVHLDSNAGPVGSLSGHIPLAGRSSETPSSAAEAVDVSARFHCSVNGGGVYTGEGDISDQQQMTMYFTVNHEGTSIVELIATPQTDDSHRLPNVQLRGNNIPIKQDGSFQLSAGLVAADASGGPAAGRPAMLRGSIDRSGTASGSMTLPPQLSSVPVSWSAHVAGPIPEPVFPHGSLTTKLISAKEVAADPAINLLYPQSTNDDGSAPGAPYAKGEVQQDQWSNMRFSEPSGGAPAEAVRSQKTPGSVYDVAAWYTSRLTAMGWHTTTDSNYGNQLGLAFLAGRNRLFIIGFSEQPHSSNPQTSYQLILREAAQPAITVDNGLHIGAPTPLVPCLSGQPATISIRGTVSGNAQTTCSFEEAWGEPKCRFPTVGFAIGQVGFIVWGPPYATNGITVRDPHLVLTLVAPAEPLQLSSSGGTLQMHGHFTGNGYDETVDLSTACK